MKILKILWLFFCSIMIVPFTNRHERELICGDTLRWAEWKETKCSKWFFFRLFAECKEFRSVIYYRLRRRFRYLPSIFLKGQNSCYISSHSTGKGLILIHGYSTSINCKSIGEKCTVFQNVTLGYSQGHIPTIGNNCVFGCGAIVLGNIRIGNNVIVGAGAVVKQDIPDNSVVTGNPCQIRPKNFNGEILDYV